MLHGLALSFEAVFAKQRRRLAKAMPARLFHVLTLTLTFHLSFTYIFFGHGAWPTPSPFSRDLSLAVSD